MFEASKSRSGVTVVHQFEANNWTDYEWVPKLQGRRHKLRMHTIVSSDIGWLPNQIWNGWL
jgi:hypothetical protein